MTYSKAKLKINGDKASSFFQAILNGKVVGQIFAYTDSALGLQLTPHNSKFLQTSILGSFANFIIII
jgi:hypothetical protein